MEAAGVEPASENTSSKIATCVSPFECRSRLGMEPSAPAASSDESHGQLSEPPLTASLLNDGRSRAAGPPKTTAHCLSSESELRVRSYVVFHRINEVMALGTRSSIPHPRRSQVAPTDEPDHGR